jgi:methionine salvage enolase-phosphatase E1
VAELDAARAAEMQTRLVVRPGNAPAPEGHTHALIRSFDELG